MRLLRRSFHSLLAMTQGILEFPKIRHCEALKKERAISLLSLEIRHCERSEAISFKIPQIAVIAQLPSLRGVSGANDEAISFVKTFY